MINFDEFFNEIREKNIRIEFNSPENIRPTLLSNEALFHLPLLAMSILMLASGLAKPKPEEIGQTIGECLERSITGFKGSSQHLGWSANLRMRTVRALAFLETSLLVEINKSTNRITSTVLGKKVISRALEEETDLSFNLKLIERSYKNINHERKIQQELI